MSEFKNKLNQPIGFPVVDWQPSSHPRNTRMSGQYCELEPVSIDLHANDLFDAFSRDTSLHNWTYLPYGPFETLAEFKSWMSAYCLGDDPIFLCVIDKKSKKAVGVASYLRIEPGMGVIEVGHIHFSPLMQGSVVSTEAMYLMMKQVFYGLGYRRYEWKCDVLNAPSCRAAQRLGFMSEGTFRQATMYKQRNRDTAWYSIIDSEWPLIKSIFEKWLSAENFDDTGRQKSSLSLSMQTALSTLR